MHLPDRAENILARILAEPRLSTGSIVFVGHSLGGLVIKQLLRSAESDAHTNRDTESFLHRVKGVVFLGTPHFGASLAGIARFLGTLARRSSSTAALERNDPNLRNLNNWYRQYCIVNGVENLVLIESRAIRLCGIRLPEWLGLVVKPDSADPGIGIRPIPIDADHIDICKPQNRDADVYIHLSRFASKQFNQSHKDVLFAECLKEQSGRMLELTDSVNKNSQQILHGIEHVISDMELLGQSTHAIERADSSIIDVEAKKRLCVAVRSRFFNGFDLTTYILRLVESVEKGDLFRASNPVKVDVLGWCARFLSLTDNTMAQELLHHAAVLGESDVLVVARAFIAASKGDQPQALMILSSLNTPLARSAAFIIVKNKEGSEAAFAWLERIGLTPNDLDPDGKFIALQICLDKEDWNKSIELAESLVESDFNLTPILSNAAAGAHLVQAVPEELRTVAINQAFFDYAQFPLAGDSHAIRHRRSAQQLYERMARDALNLDFIRESNSVSDTALWLALKDSERSGAARIELEKSMRDPSTSLRRLPLALHFGLKIDFAVAEREIERETALTGGKSVEAAIARFALAFTQDEPGKVAAYIDRHRAQLSQHLNQKGVGFIEIEMLARSGQTQQAELRLKELKEIGLTDAELNRIQKMIFEASGTDPIDQRLALYEANESLTDLRNLVIALEDREDWSKLTGFAHTLFDLTHDPRDANRYAKALYKTDQLDQLLLLLKDFPTILDQSEDLQVLRCWALFRQGTFPEALTSLRQLGASRDSANCKNLLINIAIASGDWESLQIFIEEEWNARDSRAPDDLLRAAMLAQSINSPRTRELVFESARRGTTDPNILLGCYKIATESGWEDSEEASIWFQEAAALSGSDGPIQKMSLQDLIDRQPGWENLETQSWTMLSQGKAPMFVVARLVNRSLLSLSLVPALTNQCEVDVRKRIVIHSFSGARGRIETVPKSLAMDATALLNCEIIGVLQTILDHFSVIAIPHSTLGWLFEEKRQILFHQPSQVSDAYELRQLIADGSVKELETTATISSELSQEVGEGLAAMLTDAATSRFDDTRPRHVICPYPVYRIGSLMQEEANLTGYERSLCSCLAVVEKLVEKGELTASSAQHCRTFLSLHEHPWPTNPMLEDSSILYLDDLALSYLQHLDLLSKLRRAGLTAFISVRKVAEIDALIRYQSHASKAAALIENLRLRLRKGIESGKIKVGRQFQKDEDNEIYIKSHPSQAIFELSGTCDATVADDRFYNQHMWITSDTGQRPLLTSIDILNILKDQNTISSNRHMEFMTILRQAGMSHVPLQEEELDSYLASATVSEGKLVETAELKAIRENILRVRMTDALQLPQERAWLSGIFVACFKILQAQWQDGTDRIIASAKSNWLYELMDARHWYHRFVGQTPNESDEFRMQIMSLTMFPTGRTATTRKAYWEWFEEHILIPIKEGNRLLFSDIMNQAAEMVNVVTTNALSSSDGNGRDSCRLATINAVLEHIPPLIKNALLEDKIFTRRFDIPMTAQISLGETDITFQREKLFLGIREAIAKPGISVVVLDEKEREWQVIVEDVGGVSYTVLVFDTQHIRLPYFWALSSDQTARVCGFNNEADAVNLNGGTAEKWRLVLTAGPIKDEDHEGIFNEIRLTPSRVIQSIISELKAGSCKIRTLVPDVTQYFHRLVGCPAAGDNLEGYANSEGKAHIAQLLHWRPLEGFKLSLLMSSHSFFTATIDPQNLNAEELEKALAWVQDHGDMFSKLGAIELCLTLLDKAPQVEHVLEGLVEGILTENPDDDSGRFSILSSLIVFVSGELARTRVLLDSPPFWIRLAAIAQASLIERAIISSGIELSEFAIWARNQRGRLFFMKTLVDLRIEPRWLPDFISPQQLKAEFLGRIVGAASNNQEKIQSADLRQLLFDDNPHGIRRQIKFPCPFLPGPLEGGYESKQEIPNEVLADLESKLALENLHPDSFAGLVNSALIYRIGPDHARMAANALRKVKYQLRQPKNEAQMFGLLGGLATVAAVTRSKELADEIRILSRVTRRRKPKEMTAEDEMRIALIAAAARQDLDEWGGFVGDWLTELAFEITSLEDAERLLADLRCMTELEPALTAPCAKGEAALSSMTH